MELFDIPKVELHAHLNGSLRDSTLLELHHHKYDNDEVECERYTNFEKNLSMSDCFKKFSFAHDLTDTPERLAIATKRVIEEFSNENTIYLELRSTPRATQFMTKDEYVTVILDTIIEMRDGFPGILVKYLPSIDRAKSVESNQETLDCILRYLNSDEYTDCIVGLDFSGDPSKGEFPDFIPMLKEARANGLKLSIHCAEIEGRAKETKEILNSGLVDRIGHGTFLDETPELWSLFQAQKLLVECCLTSNLKCGTVAEVNNHHLQKLIRANNPLAICTDDCGVFSTDLTTEYELAQKAFNLKMEDLERITRESIKAAFCSEEEKMALLDIVSSRLNGL